MKFFRSKAKDKTKEKKSRISLQPLPPIHLSRPLASQTSPAARWDNYLVWFLRLLALLWLSQGLILWSHIILSSNLQPEIFKQLPQSLSASLMFFSVMDLVVGVALWFATAWSGILWLVMLLAKAFIFFLTRSALFGDALLMGFYSFLVLLYFLFNYRWSHAQKKQRQ